jgi:hypothetical protein
VYFEIDGLAELIWLKKNANNTYDQYSVKSTMITKNVKEELIKIGNSVDG